MTTMEEPQVITAEKPVSGEELRAIEDPQERLRRSAEAAERAAAAAEEHRALRNAAALQLYRSGVPAVEVWDRTIHVSRSLWTRIANDPDAVVGDFEDPRATAAAEAELTRQHDAAAIAAQQVRNETARGLMNGEYGAPVRNAEVAKLARLTSARVAQLRTSY